MSHLRDLQKLRNTKNIQFYSARNSQYTPQETTHYNFQKFGEIDSKLLPKQSYSKYLQSKQILPKTRQKKVHRRGISNGLVSQQKKQKGIVSPGLSIYNFSMKLTERKSNPLTARKERMPETIHIQKHILPKKQKDILSKNSFSVLYPVGKGGFGKVWKVEGKKTNKIYAMKQMFKAKIIEKKSINSVMNERTLLSKVRHPFLVNMIYAFQDRQYLYLIMDYVNGGDLRYHIGKHRSFTQKQTKFFIANLIVGLGYLHENRIIHRDIKPENLVLDSDGYLRITDLGVSRQLRQENYQDTSGTPGYMAPQVMCRKNHGFASDFFAVGVIGYEFMLGKRPYNGKNRKQIRDQVLSKQACIKLDQLPYKWSPDAADFINKLLIRNPQHRLGYNGISQLKQHKWFKTIDWQKLVNKQLSPPYVPLSIEQDYDDYKQQISEDTIMQNLEQNMLMLRDQQVQNLFEGYTYIPHEKKRTTSYATNFTDAQHLSKVQFRR